MKKYCVDTTGFFQCRLLIIFVFLHLLACAQYKNTSFFNNALLDLDEKNEITELFKMAPYYTESHKLKDAIIILGNLFTYNEANAEAMMELEFPHFRNILKSVTMFYSPINFNQQLEIFRKEIAVYFNKLGMQEIRKMNYAKAVSYFFDCIIIDPMNGAAYEDLTKGFLYLALNYQKSNDFERAVMYYKKAISLNTHFEQAKASLAMLYYNYAVKIEKKGMINEALNYYQLAFMSDQRNRFAEYKYAELYFKKRKWQEKNKDVSGILYPNY